MEKTAGIVVDNWKLPVFRKRLEEAGYQFTEEDMREGMTVLKVPYTSQQAIHRLVISMNDECAKGRLN